MSLPRASQIALAVAITLTFLFVVWAFQALQPSSLTAFDEEVARTFTERAPTHNTRRSILILFTIIGSVPAMTSLALVGVIWQCARRDWVLAVAWAAIVAGGGLFNLALKKSLDRPRPDVEMRDAAVHETNESFPSGQSMGGVIGYGMLAYFLLQVCRPFAARIAVIALVAAVIGFIGFSRIYLRAHWFSDVVGGFIIGAAWLSFGLAWIAVARRRWLAPADRS